MALILEVSLESLKRQSTRADTGKNAYSLRRNLAQGNLPRRRYHLDSMKRYFIPAASFLLGSFLITGIYLAVLTWAQDWSFAVSQFARDREVVLPIIVAFGIQSALYSILRFRLLVPVPPMGASRAAVGVSGSTSATAMVACCLHHMTSVLPILGISAATAFLARYQRPFLQLSLAMNIAGILLMLAVLLRERQRAVPVAGTI